MKAIFVKGPLILKTGINSAATLLVDGSHLSCLYFFMVKTIYLFSFVETPRKFIIAFYIVLTMQTYKKLNM